jgi:tRNA-dihydrouridine synthase
MSPPRSLQFYTVDPGTLAQAVRRVVADDLADHIDLNFGCPVPKVTRKGGGSALPWKRDLFRDIVTAAVTAADGRIPVTVKMRKGIDDDHLTYLEAGRAAADAGVAWIALHARTAEQFYGGTADWSAIARLKAAIPDIPILGNGDIWTPRRCRSHDGRDRVRRSRDRPRLSGPTLVVRAVGRSLVRA